MIPLAPMGVWEALLAFIWCQRDSKSSNTVFYNKLWHWGQNPYFLIIFSTAHIVQPQDLTGALKWAKSPRLFDIEAV